MTTAIARIFEKFQRTTREDRTRSNAVASQLLTNVLDYWFEGGANKTAESLSSLLGSSVRVVSSHFKVITPERFIKDSGEPRQSFDLYTHAYSSEHPPILCYSAGDSKIESQIETSIGCSEIKDQIFYKILEDYLMVLADLTHKNMPLNLLEKIELAASDFNRLVHVHFSREQSMIHLRLKILIYGREWPVNLVCSVPPALSCGQLGNIA